ncbi:MAG: NAD(P)/FAD-dependent oxidoreductase, partial [Rhodospirillales bacterium]|nr:NAD(P)/FAD-dependent oxidoreductase [Rhodospirillales bacterium]
MSDRSRTQPDPAGAPRTSEVAIIGAGFGGIGMAIRLRQAGIDDFVLLEQASDIGGTWRDNHYPGCACDIPANLYSLSFAPRAAWSRRYPTQPEILDYLHDCVARFDLQPHLRLGAALQEAVFDAARGLWCLRLADGARIEARMLVLSLGQLHRPAIPAVEGLDRFAGPCFHSARWDHGVDLAGKRVAVIGTGASAIQFVPRIAEQAAQLDVYQRTPPWILPKHDPAAEPLRLRALRLVPLLRRTLRAVTYWQHEARAVGFVLAPRLMQAVERRARSHAKRQLADGDVRSAMTPEYRIGCKRILLSNDFLPALNRPNVTLLTRPIARVTPAGVCTDDGGERPADVLILATGFRASDPLGDLRIIGRDGANLAQAWRDRLPTRLGLAMP